MAHRRSPLSSRVHRILATDGLPTQPLGVLRWAGGVIVVATAMAAPGFAARAPEPAVALDSAAAPPSTLHASPFTSLNQSIDQMQGEIQALIVLAAERQVPSSTVHRLERLYVRARRVRTHVDQLEQQMRRLNP